MPFITSESESVWRQWKRQLFKPKQQEFLSVSKHFETIQKEDFCTTELLCFFPGHMFWVSSWSFTIN